MPPDQIVRYILNAIQEHPPLFYVVLHGWMAVAGDGEAALRMAHRRLQFDLEVAG